MASGRQAASLRSSRRAGGADRRSRRFSGAVHPHCRARFRRPDRQRSLYPVRLSCGGRTDVALLQQHSAGAGVGSAHRLLHHRELSFSACCSAGWRSIWFASNWNRGAAAAEPRRILSLAVLFIKELILSGWRVARLVTSPRMDLRPGIFAYPLKVSSDFEITLLANLITLTPGTLSGRSLGRPQDAFRSRDRLFRCRKDRARDQGWIRAQDRGGFQLMAGESFLDIAVQIAFALLSLSFLLTVLRVLKGPTLPDRILALDMLVAVGIGFIAVTGLASGVTFNVDIAIALGLVGFLATVAFARFVLVHSKKDDDPQLQIKKKT